MGGGHNQKNFSRRKALENSRPIINCFQRHWHDRQMWDNWPANVTKTKTTNGKNYEQWLWHRDWNCPAVYKTRFTSQQESKNTINWMLYTRLTALFPGLPRWAGTRKIKPTWISRKQETVSGSGISWAICKSAPRSREMTTPAPHQLNVIHL